MTDETPRGEDAPRPDPKKIRYRVGDGEWHELDVKRKQTGDPELDALWAMPYGELRKIVEDESHPLNAKAKVVAREAAEPVREALDAVFNQMNETVRPMVESVLKNIPVMPHFPKLDLGGGFRPFGEQVGHPGALTERVPALPLDLEAPLAERNDLSDVAEEMTMAAIERANEESALQLRQVGILGDLLDETRANSASSEASLKLSREAFKVAKGSRTAGWWAAGAAIAAALVAGAGIWVTALQ